MKRNGVVMIVAMALQLLLLSGFSSGDESSNVVIEDTKVKNKRHHVVGEDRGWDSSSDIASWSYDRLFMVGDDVWFAYSAAEEMIAELKSKEEFESCDVSNPIRTYADGLNIVPLVDEGHRYFASSKAEKCKNGLKLHVDVAPIGGHKHKAEQLLAQPPKPSEATSPQLSLLIVFSYLIISCTAVFLLVQQF
ncbi:hypothetical protein Syun_009788 [Stephania yunnanensis]|uniref:Phytocyanin domain-containing protein n=1 Tax=Stephania yunnanensis TaxID=152371 RepID=A0AAP0PR01_9MAGN